MGIPLTDLPAKNLITQDGGVPMLSAFLPIRTKAEGNANEHWRVRHARSRSQRLAITRAFAGLRVPKLPISVTFTRYSPATMDDDNLPGAMKHLRDALAALYGVGDSPRDPIAWRVLQEKCKPRTFGVRVTIQAAA